MKKILLLLLLAGPVMGACPKYNFADSRLNDEHDNMCHEIFSVLKANPVRISTLAVANQTGVTDGSAACAGCVGEYIESVVGPVNFPTSNQYGDMTSIILTAGDWDVVLNVESELSTGVGFTTASYGISTTAGNDTTGLVKGSNRAFDVMPGSAVNDNSVAIPAYRVSISGSTTMYAKMFAIYSSGQPKVYGRLSARRVR